MPKSKRPPPNPKGNPDLPRGMKPGQVRDEKGRIRNAKDLEPPPPRVEGDFDRLKAMMHVLNNPPSTDLTEGEKACRVWLAKSPGAFMDALDDLAKRGEKAASYATSEAPIAETESDAEVREAIHELLKSFAKRRML